MGKTIKVKVADKKAKLDKKLAAKVKPRKARKTSAAVAALALLAAFALGGCMDTAPASRATTASYTIRFDFDDGARNNTVNLTLGDGALASADSAGSTETQTATPTMDIKPDVDVTVPVSKGAGGAAADAAASLADAAIKGAAKAFTGDAVCADGSCNPGGACIDGSCNP